MERMRPFAIFQYIAIVTFLTATLFFILEGAGSAYLTTQEIIKAFDSRVIRFHTRYDPELGWTNLESATLKDVYGPGRSITVNSQGVRAAGDLDRSPARGTHRIIISGDSFTFGDEAGDLEVWPALLDDQLSRAEVMNLAVNAYGLDQMYLRYLKFEERFDHDLHLVVFIPWDYYRLELSRFMRAGKPYFRVEDGVPVLKNTPVPHGWFSLRALNDVLGALERLAVVRLGHRILGNTTPDVLSLPTGIAPEETRHVAGMIFDRLEQNSAERKRTLVVVCIPDSPSLVGDGAAGLRAFVAETLRFRHIPYLDLVEAARALPAHTAGRLFTGGLQGGHYTSEGHRWVAAQIRTFLLQRELKHLE